MAKVQGCRLYPTMVWLPVDDIVPLMASRRYRAYLLRLWWSDGPRWTWYASLEDPHTGERKGFATLPELIAFLTTEAQESNDSEASDDASVTKITGNTDHIVTDHIADAT